MGWLGGCTDCLIENNYFENNGFKGAIFYHNIYISAKGFTGRNITVSNNTIKNSTRVDGKCQGTSFVVHGIIENLTIGKKYDQRNKG